MNTLLRQASIWRGYQRACRRKLLRSTRLSRTDQEILARDFAFLKRVLLAYAWEYRTGERLCFRCLAVEHGSSADCNNAPAEEAKQKALMRALFSFICRGKPCQ